MMNEGELEFCGKIEEQNVSVLLKEEAPKPFVIYYQGGPTSNKRRTLCSYPRLVVKAPAPFRYTKDKAVPWNYLSQAVMQEP